MGSPSPACNLRQLNHLGYKKHCQHHQWHGHHDDHQSHPAWDAQKQLPWQMWNIPIKVEAPGTELRSKIGSFLFKPSPSDLLVVVSEMFLGPRGPLRVPMSVHPSTRPPVHPRSFYFSHLKPPQRHRHKGTATKHRHKGHRLQRSFRQFLDKNHLLV